MSTLADYLDRLTVEGELYESLPDGAVRCYACGHRCLIREGRRGICQVRFNQEGKLLVPWGYVAALQVDPIEKKPFFHILPGTDALTFGMLGCDFHCGYCVPGDTIVITNRGPMAIEEAFKSVLDPTQRHDAEIAYPIDLETIAGSGQPRKVRAIFKHRFQGELAIIQPYFLPALRCTSDHRVYATEDITCPPSPIQARFLTEKHFLAVPRQYGFSSPQVIDAAKELDSHEVTYKVRWDLPPDQREFIAQATMQGQTSRQIGVELEKDPSYIRHVRSKQMRGIALDTRTSGALVEGETVRFPNEHHPGIPLKIPLDVSMARLLGYYCAEGSVVKSKHRPNSLVLNFSLSPQEVELAGEIRQLFKDCLGLETRMVQRPTTLGVCVSKASAALLFKTLAGGRAREKKVPRILFEAPNLVVQAFLEAYAAGDGHYYENGKVSATTVSRELAYGIGMLALKMGYFPSLYDTPMPEEGTIQGRKVTRSPHQYTLVWYADTPPQRKVIETDNYYLVPIQNVNFTDYAGDVYNLEVEEEHNYLAGFLLISNCQNWLTSQAMRDSASDVSIDLVRRVSPEQLVTYAMRSGAGVIATSYNEPLITSEWAVSIFRQANQAGLSCVYISNGNATPEALEYLRPHIVGYKVDLKTMQDKHYRKLGGVRDHVLETIRMAHESGLWVEVVTLIVPGFNDSTEELMDAARYIASVSRDIPWHVTAFHPDYKMIDPPPTAAKTLLRAAEIGQEAGLNYVYAGNLPGRTGEYEHTSCPKCGVKLIERYGYVIRNYRLTAEGACPECNTPIPGIWNDKPEQVRLGGPGMPIPISR